MSRFLDNLLQRAVQESPAIRPVLPSLFGAAKYAAGWTATNEAVESVGRGEGPVELRPHQRARHRQNQMAVNEATMPAAVETHDDTQSESEPYQPAVREAANCELPAERKNIGDQSEWRADAVSLQPAKVKEVGAAEASIPEVSVNSMPVTAERAAHNRGAVPVKTRSPKANERDVAAPLETAVPLGRVGMPSADRDEPTLQLRARAEHDNDPIEPVQEQRWPAFVYSAQPVTPAAVNSFEQGNNSQASLPRLAMAKVSATARSAMEPPTIQVTIGRIEVRANTLVQGPQRRSETTQPSLNEYLKKRSTRSHG
ncbi:MAG TPA: hypothetical protein VIB39_13490 [Candidatus Angelobacter sp.]|jgi:hypothetical protein